MQLKQLDPKKLKPAKYNPRRIGAEELKRLAKLIDKHGFVSPVIARAEDYLVIGGHQRIKALKHTQTEISKIPVILLSGLDDNRAKTLNIALNNTNAQGVFDTDMLAAILEEIETEDLAEWTGFTEEQLEDFQSGFNDIDIDEFIKTDLPPEQPPPSDEKTRYILSGLTEAFTDNLLKDLRKIVCPAGITIEKG